jgi:hypothetical protein
MITWRTLPHEQLDPRKVCFLTMLAVFIRLVVWGIASGRRGVSAEAPMGTF